MSLAPDPAVEASIDRVVQTVSEWPGVRAVPHRFSGTAFLLGPREIGHVHRSGAVDIHFPRALRERVRRDPVAGAELATSASGWTTYRVVDQADERTAHRLLRLSYLFHACRRRNVPVGLPSDSEVATELAALGVADDFGTVFATPLEDQRD